MQFLYPSFLFALVALVIPVIIHLFNFRKYKPIYFPRVKFISEIQKQTQSASKLKHLLVLIARMLTILFLVLAFAQPYIPYNNEKINQAEKAVSIYIDNTFSMEAVNSNGILLDEAKRKAREIIKAYKASDLFQLITADFEGKHQRFVNKDEFEVLLEEVKITPKTKKIEEIISRQHEQLSSVPDKYKLSFIISDFQKSFFDFTTIKSDSSIKTNLIPVYALKKDNVYIDSVWFESPIRQINRQESLMVRIKNTGEKNLENIPLKLFINKQLVTPSSFNIESGSTTDINLKFSHKEFGMQHGLLKITDYPISYDDDFYFSYSISPEINTLVINAENSSEYLDALLGQDTLIKLSNQSEKNIDYQSLTSKKLIILNELKNISSGLAQELEKFVNNGGSLAIFPHQESDLQEYKQFLSGINADYFTSWDTTKLNVSKINLDQQLFSQVFTKIPENIDLPIIKSHFKLNSSVRNKKENLLNLQNGDAFLNLYNCGKGKLYLFTSTLKSAHGNFPKHALFVPIMYNMALFSQNNLPPYYSIGEKKSIEITNTNQNSEQVYHLTNPSINFDVIPQHQFIDGKNMIDVHDQLTSAGNYLLGDGKKTEQILSFNYNRKESDLSFHSTDELESQVANLKNFNLFLPGEKSLTESINVYDMGIRYWKLCIILALLFMGMEIAILRFWPKS